MLDGIGELVDALGCDSRCRSADAERGDRAAGGVEDGGAHTTEPLVVLLVVNGISAGADPAEFGLEVFESGDGPTRVARKTTLGDEALDLLERQVCEEDLSEVGRMGRVALPHRSGNPKRPASLDSFDVERLAVVEHCEMSGLPSVSDEIFEEGQRLLPEIHALHHEARQLEDTNAESVSAASRIALD